MGDEAPAPLYLVRYSDTNDYYFGTVTDRSDEGATVLYLDGTWELRNSADLLESVVESGTPIVWASQSEERRGRIQKVLGLAAEVIFDDGDRSWVSLAHIRISGLRR